MNNGIDSERLADLFHGLNKPALNAYLALSMYRRTAAQQSLDEANRLLEEHVVELKKMLNDQSSNLEKSKSELGEYKAIYTRYKEQFDEISCILRESAEGAFCKSAEFERQSKRLFEIDQDNIRFANHVISETSYQNDK